MGERTSLRLLDAPGVGVYDVRCSEPAGGPGAEEPTGVTQVVLPLEGVFAVHDGREVVTADPATAVVLRAGREHRVGHPATDGDRSLVLVFPPEVVDEALGEDGLGGPVGPRAHLGARMVLSATDRQGPGELDAEETAHLLLGVVGEDLGAVQAYRPRGSHQRERVEHVRELLAAAPGRRWRLDELGRAVHSSPFHLARQFRAATGSSIGQALLRLRLALALERLAAGEDDLSALAADLGFASQSHFGERFRSVLGTTPGALRDSLTAGRPAELRTFLTAEDRAAS